MYDVTFYQQDTHCASTGETKWKDNWANNIFFSIVLMVLIIR